MIETKIFHLLEGAEEARGTVVIIDVFRAFSLECYLYEMGASLVRPVGSLEEAWALKERFPDAVLVGERKGIRCEGFDFGNSPSQLRKEDIEGRLVIHTTSAGTQGIVHACGADEVITGSVVNARAIARYILEKEKRAPETVHEVSLVAMGLSAKERTDEDELCAEYIRNLLSGKEMPDLAARLSALRNTSGKRFFDPKLQEHFPKEDFALCTAHDSFPFVLRIGKDEWGLFSEKIYISDSEKVSM